MLLEEFVSPDKNIFDIDTRNNWITQQVWFS